MNFAELDRYTRLAPVLRIYRSLLRLILKTKHVTPPSLALKRRPRVLIVGIYLADRPNTAAHLAKSFASSRLLELEQCWAAMLGSEAPPELRGVTTKIYPDGKPKFPAINELIAEKKLDDYDFVVVCDDDIVVPRGFIDAYITTQIAGGLAIAQAARTPSSCGSKTVTIRERGSLARQTRFVEIGPLFSLSSALFDELLPFDESNPMGWGFDYHWPVIAEEKALRIGIIDRTPVDHSLRPLASAYSGERAKADMTAYLARNRHLTRQEAEVTLRRLALSEP